MTNGPENTELGKDAGVVAGSSAPAAAPGAPAMEEGDPQFEAAVRQALLPELPPAGFANRLMARALAGDRPLPVAGATHAQSGKLLHWPQSRLWITGAVAAALIVGVFEGGIAWRHVREQQQRIVQATQQFQTTERITVHALAQAREQLQRAGVPLTLD